MPVLRQAGHVTFPAGQLADPELVEQHVPERVVLVVPDAGPERRHGARV